MLYLFGFGAQSQGPFNPNLIQIERVSQENNLFIHSLSLYRDKRVDSEERKRGQENSVYWPDCAGVKMTPHPSSEQ